MNKKSLLTMLVCCMCLVVGCSNETKNRITIFKHKSGNEYQSIAYKKEIDHQKAEKLLEILAKKKEKSQANDNQKDTIPSYKLYFNNRSGSDKITVHSIWLKSQEEAIVKQNSTYLKLTKKETDYIIGFLTGIE